MSAEGSKGYEAAVQRLTALINSHYRPKGSDAEGTFSKMPLWLKRVGLADVFDKLSVIHVAGTKGKGSTCAFSDSILRTAGYRTGLFTSPHLVDIRERIRIEGALVSKELFAEAFWHCYESLKEPDSLPESERLGYPPYFYFLTLVALRVFSLQKVDVAILEVGLGGRLDATNAAPSPAVCGISTLGYDHMEILGDTLALIAGEKAGIMKRGVPCFTAPQLPEAQEVLESTAARVGAPLRAPPPLERYGSGGAEVELGLAGEHQRVNASLAVALCREWGLRARPGDAFTAESEKAFAAGALPEAFRRGLADADWPGRGQTIFDPPAALSDGSPSATTEAAAAAGGASSAAPSAHKGVLFFLDGAHTGESTELCTRWFLDASAAAAAAGGAGGAPGAAQADPERILLFNCLKERDPIRLLRPIAATCLEKGTPFAHSLFVPSDSVAGPQKAASGQPDLQWQTTLRTTWDSLQQSAGGAAAAAAAAGSGRAAEPPRSAVLPSLREAVSWLRRRSIETHPRPVHVLVVGSLYLVGDMLRILGRVPH